MLCDITVTAVLSFCVQLVCVGTVWPWGHSYDNVVVPPAKLTKDWLPCVKLCPLGHREPPCVTSSPCHRDLSCSLNFMETGDGCPCDCLCVSNVLSSVSFLEMCVQVCKSCVLPGQVFWSYSKFSRGSGWGWSSRNYAPSPTW